MTTTPTPTTWRALLERNAQNTPDGIALIDGTRTLTHAELLVRVRSLMGGFRSIGITPGQVVAVWLPNCIEWVETAAALAALGATALGVNTKLRSHDVRGLLARADCDVLVTSPGFKGIDFTDMLREIHTVDASAVRLVVEVPDPSATAPEAVAGTHSDQPRSDQPPSNHQPSDRSPSDRLPFATVDYGHLLAAPAEDVPAHDPQSHASAFTSSGSTGVPKIIMHSQAGLIGHSAAVANTFGYTDDSTVVLAALPLCGVFGLNTLMAALVAGRPTVLQAVFDPQGTVDLITEHHVTHTNMADAMLAMMLDAVKEPEQLVSLREVGFGNFTATDVRGIIERGNHLGKRFFQTYGSSEAQALMCYPPEDADMARLAQGGGVPVSPLTQVRVALVDDAQPLPEDGQPAPEDGQPAPEDAHQAPSAPADNLEPQPGEIQIRGPFLSPGRITEHGYEDTPVDDEGWFSTGDLGFMRSEDDVVYLSRMGDVLRLGGFLVAPQEVEDFLITIPGIAEAQFVAAPTARGLTPVAFVILDPAHADTFSEEAVITDCRAVLAHFKVPRRVIPVEAFPTVRGANGDKIQRNRLREMAEAVLTS